MEGMLAEVRGFAGNFAPRSWSLCEGQLLSINANQALFSIIGTIYGGDGRTTFALPDLRGRVMIGPGNGPGLSSRREGQKGGTEVNYINQTQMPSHTHTATGKMKAYFQPPTGNADSNQPSGRYLGAPATGTNIYSSQPPNIDMGDNSVTVTATNTGGSQSVNNMQPWLAVYYIICVQGVFPSRN